MEKGKQIVENEEEDNNGNGPNGGGGFSSDSDFDQFNPTDAKLLELYSKNKILEKHIRNDRIRDVNIYDYHPEQLFEECKLDREHGYFYTPRKRKSMNSSQVARAAGNGFWRSGGSVIPILSNNTTVGYKRTLLYKEGKPKTAQNTSWRMIEYILDQPQKDSAIAALAANASDMKLDDCLCEIYNWNLLQRGEGTSVENSRNSQQQQDDHVDVPNSLHGHPLPQPQPQPQPLEQHNSDFGEPMQDMECDALLDALFKSFERKNH